MKLKNYIRDYVLPTEKLTAREVFAKKIKIKISYLHNICQNPQIAGKKTILKIEKYTNGMVLFSDMSK